MSSAQTQHHRLRDYPLYGSNRAERHKPRLEGSRGKCTNGLVDVAVVPATYHWEIEESGAIAGSEFSLDTRPWFKTALNRTFCKECFLEIISEGIDQQRDAMTVKNIWRCPRTSGDSVGLLREDDTDLKSLTESGIRGVVSLKGLLSDKNWTSCHPLLSGMTSRTFCSTLAFLTNGDHCVGGLVAKDPPGAEAYKKFGLPFETEYRQEGIIKVLYGREIQYAIINPYTNSWSLSAQELSSECGLSHAQQTAFLAACRRPQPVSTFELSFLVTHGVPLSTWDRLVTPTHLVSAKCVALSSGPAPKGVGRDQMQASNALQSGGYPGGLNAASSGQLSTHLPQYPAYMTNYTGYPQTTTNFFPFQANQCPASTNDFGGYSQSSTNFSPFQADQNQGAEWGYRAQDSTSQTTYPAVPTDNFGLSGVSVKPSFGQASISYGSHAVPPKRKYDGADVEEEDGRNTLRKR